MSILPSDKRPRLRDIVRGNAADFQKAWNETEASAGFDPLPIGVYRCLIADGALHQAKTGTPGFKITFEVVDGPSVGRKVWHDVWLSNKALGVAKAELAKLGITSPDQLERPLPPGLIADVTVVQRTDDNGTTFNRVKMFKVIKDDTPADDFRPADLDGEKSEGDARRLDDRTPARPREPGEDDDLDADGFNWRTGVQAKPAPHVTSSLDAAKNRKRAT